VEALLRNEAAAGATNLGSGSGVAELYSGMLSGGGTHTRSGAAASMLDAANNLEGSVCVNGDASKVSIMASYISNQGG
jgi:hypothetical protein